jgi:hypothetical protein
MVTVQEVSQKTKAGLLRTYHQVRENVKTFPGFLVLRKRQVFTVTLLKKTPLYFHKASHLRICSLLYNS